jgi:hypothetical protein
MKSIQDSQQGTFARAIGANQRHMLASLNRQGNIAQRLHMTQLQAHMLE